MRYDIGLSIGYRYGAPADHLRTLVRLLPSDLPGRQVVTARLLAVDPPPTERRETRDFFGNVVTMLAFHHAIDAIAFTLRARVERVAQVPGLDLSPDLAGLAAEIAAHPALAAIAPHHYLGPSARVRPDPAISTFAAAAAGSGRTAMQIVTALGQALHATMRFDPASTDVHTPASAAFAARSGVCQDFSHIMIAGLRSLGIPSGYVSGFLRTTSPQGQRRLEGADAMHAWVTAWCGSEAGWIEYDPTNACALGQDHIVVAYGRDYADVSPVRGALRTTGDQASHQRVDVIAL